MPLGVFARIRTFGAEKRGTLAVLTASLLSLGMYACTLHPGLGRGDSAEFQYVGRLLQPAHSPGYPLYVTMLFVWSHLVPFGSLALRANLLSAICAAAAAGVVARAAMLLGCRAWVATAAAVALACGRVYWSQATVAEVYAFGALILAGVICATLRGRALALGGLVGAGIAHQPLVMFLAAPAVAGYVFLSKGLQAWRRLVVVALVASCGLLPYLWVVANAGSLARGVHVVTASSFRKHVFSFTATQFFAERVPLAGAIVFGDLGPLGILAAAFGLVVLVRRPARWAQGALLLGGSGTTLLFVAAYNVQDVAVFAIPAFILLWLLGAIGFSAAWEGAKAGWLRAMVAFLVVATPAIQFASNIGAADRSADIRDTRDFDALVRLLPSGAVVVGIEFPLDRMLKYACLAAGRGDISISRPRAIGRSARSGRPTFVVTKTTAPPRGSTEIPVYGARLEEFMRLAGAGDIVVLCGREVPAGATRSRILRAMGVDGDAPDGRNVAIVMVVGRQGGAVVSAGRRAEVSVSLRDLLGEPAGGTKLSATSDDAGISIELDGRPVGVGRQGMLVARIGANTRDRAFTLSEDLRVESSVRLFRVVVPVVQPTR